MGRATDQDVHSAFVEYRASPDDKCLSVQCIYCHQIRAKNTSRQKQHLLECLGLRNHPSSQVNQSPSQPPPPRPESSSSDVAGYGPAFSINGAANALDGATAALNGTPMQGRQSLPPTLNGSETPIRGQSAKPKPTPKLTPGGSNIPAPPLEDVHSAFVEFRANESDKCLSVQCIYCNQIRAKNTSRQRQHLLECPTYLNVMKDSIPANNLLHRFDEGEVARSLSLPQPALDLDFRMSVKLNPKVAIGSSTATNSGQRNWISFIGGQWAGRWGKGIVIPGGQDAQVTYKDFTTSLNAQYLIQTSDDPPAFILVKYKGWLAGPRDVLEKVHTDPEEADTVPANQYKFRVNIELETGDERYAFLTNGMWLGSGSRRVQEIVIDAYRVG
ncbi:hypothetical protein LTR05_000153 [Lithohypha guttulata]|uniref:Uncharacterized protein n=1 Tax=Lithohypha guttulata TaxID=1690604 RepID=A0AAN7Y8L8_9EURO|nr:hypothetical protein LTR05_000153 [Lithohypha guttulata]